MSPPAGAFSTARELSADMGARSRRGAPSLASGTIESRSPTGRQNAGTSRAERQAIPASSSCSLDQDRFGRVPFLPRSNVVNVTRALSVAAVRANVATGSTLRRRACDTDWARENSRRPSAP